MLCDELQRRRHRGSAGLACRKPLAYFNQSVYPFYLVHMTILLVALWYVRLWIVPWHITFLTLTGITFVSCWVFFEAVKRTKTTRALFGIKPLWR